MALIFRTFVILTFSSAVITLLIHMFESSVAWQGFYAEAYAFAVIFSFVFVISAFGLLAMMPLAMQLTHPETSFPASLIAFTLASSLLGFLILLWIALPTVWGAIAGGTTGSMWMIINHRLFRSVPRG